MHRLPIAFFVPFSSLPLFPTPHPTWPRGNQTIKEWMQIGSASLSSRWWCQSGRSSLVCRSTQGPRGEASRPRALFVQEETQWKRQQDVIFTLQPLGANMLRISITFQLDDAPAGCSASIERSGIAFFVFMPPSGKESLQEVLALCERYH